MLKYSASGFVQKVCEADTQVTIFLANGVKLIGQIAGYETDDTGALRSLVLARSNQIQLVFVAQVATILPEDSIHLSE